MTEAARDMTDFRDGFIKDEVVPEVAGVFKRHSLTSAYLLVSQFWADEADDAVHATMLWSRLPKPDLKAGLESLDEWDEESKDLVNLADPPNRLCADGQHGVHDYLECWDENLAMIPLFAQYCTEGCDQEMKFSEAYVPCLLFVLAGDKITYSIVGENVRPWLEGVTPEWVSDGDLGLTEDELPKWVKS